MTHCDHAQPDPGRHAGAVLCVLGRYGGRPSLGVCAVCPARTGPPPALAAKPVGGVCVDPWIKPGPGSTLHRVLAVVARRAGRFGWLFEADSSCRCHERIRLMNGWGWRGCVRRAPVIAGWLLTSLAGRVRTHLRSRRETPAAG